MDQVIGAMVVIVVIGLLAGGVFDLAHTAPVLDEVSCLKELAASQRQRQDQDGCHHGQFS